MTHSTTPEADHGLCVSCKNANPPRCGGDVGIYHDASINLAGASGVLGERKHNVE